MKNSKANWNLICEYLLIAAIIVVVGLIVCTNLFHYCYKMNADIASEAVLARLIWESREWIPKSWYPSTELRIWQAPNLAAMIYGITSNMVLSMGIACIIMTMGTLFSAYFFIFQFSFERTEKLSFLLLCLIIPNHFVTLELYYLFGSYYALHVMIMFFTLGVYVQLISGKHSHVLWLGITVLLSFMIGMQGVREILVLNGPLLATEILRQFYLVYVGTWKNKRNFLVCVWCILLLIAGYAGTLLPFSVGQSVSRNIRNGFTKLIRTVFPDVFDCLGLTETQTFGKLLLIALLIIGMVSLFVCISRISKKQGTDHTIWAYIMLWISPVITMLIVAFTTTESSQRYYFIILLALAFGFVYCMRWIKEKMTIMGFVGYALVLFLFIFHVNKVYVPIIQSEEPTRDTKYEVCRYLEDNGFQIGYANFEIANTMTVLSGGTIRVASVASVEKMDVCKWLSSTEWYVPNVPYKTRTAYIVAETELEAFNTFYGQHRENIWFNTQIGQFLIYESDYNFSCLE